MKEINFMSDPEDGHQQREAASSTTKWHESKEDNSRGIELKQKELDFIVIDSRKRETN